MTCLHVDWANYYYIKSLIQEVILLFNYFQYNGQNFQIISILKDWNFDRILNMTC